MKKAAERKRARTSSQDSRSSGGRAGGTSEPRRSGVMGLYDEEMLLARNRRPISHRGDPAGENAKGSCQPPTARARRSIAAMGSILEHRRNYGDPRHGIKPRGKSAATTAA